MDSDHWCLKAAMRSCRRRQQGLKRLSAVTVLQHKCAQQQLAKKQTLDLPQAVLMLERQRAAVAAARS